MLGQKVHNFLGELLEALPASDNEYIELICGLDQRCKILSRRIANVTRLPRIEPHRGHKNAALKPLASQPESMIAIGVNGRLGVKMWFHSALLGGFDCRAIR